MQPLSPPDTADGTTSRTAPFAREILLQIHRLIHLQPDGRGEDSNLKALRGQHPRPWCRLRHPVAVLHLGPVSPKATI